MKKIAFVFLVLIGFAAQAQKFCYVDTKYILEEIPEYGVAMDQINELSVQWQREIENEKLALDDLFKNYQAEQVLLSDKMKQSREEEILEKERSLKMLKKQYFGPKGELFNKQEALIRPLQEQIQAAITEYAEIHNYAVVFDKSGDLVMVFSDVKYDKSDAILQAMGY